MRTLATADGALSRVACRVCHAPSLEVVLDLGAQPLANAFLGPDELDRSEPRYLSCP